MAKIPNQLIGAAGVHYVACELSLRGLIALPTIRNAPGIDLVVVDPPGRWHANLQVKTSQQKADFWLLGAGFRDFKGPFNYYVFLRYLPKQGRFETFLEAAENVIKDAEKAIKESRERGNKEFAPWWPLPRDANTLAKVREQWEQFGPPKTPPKT